MGVSKTSFSLNDGTSGHTGLCRGLPSDQAMAGWVVASVLFAFNTLVFNCFPMVHTFSLAALFFSRPIWSSAAVRHARGPGL